MSCAFNINEKNSELARNNYKKNQTHPCYNASAHNYARIHLPVAPACNISCNYCNRKFDCLHETRPGVSSEVLSPEQAFDKYVSVKEQINNLKVVGIAGPGDALANFDNTKKTLKLIKDYNPEATFCLSTNGLLLPEYIGEIVELGVSHITVTINTINPFIGVKIYRYINYQGKRYTGLEGAEILLENQLKGLEILNKAGIIAKVNIVMIKGVNEKNIPEVVKEVKNYAVFMTNIMPLIPAEGSQFENMPLVSNKELKNLRDQCSLDMKQMYHCQQCRADAIGLLSDDKSAEFRSCKSSVASKEESKEDYIDKYLNFRS
ncbi:nitrogenase cofactor biosynthesis protein NifB [Natronospora cellulosivora (SeqCode)]